MTEEGRSFSINVTGLATVKDERWRKEPVSSKGSKIMGFASGQIHDVHDDSLEGNAAGPKGHVEIP